MSGYNIYILKPEIIDGPPQQLKASVYMRYRPDDDNPGSEDDMGIPAKEFVLGSGAFNAQNTVIQAGVRSAIDAMYGLTVTDSDLLNPPGKTAGLNRFFTRKEWREAKA